MRVEITENKLRDAGYDLTGGDIITVPDEVGSIWCRFGWARDVEGNVATGERKPGAQEIQPQKARHVSRKEA